MVLIDQSKSISAIDFVDVRQDDVVTGVLLRLRSPSVLLILLLYILNIQNSPFICSCLRPSALS